MIASVSWVWPDWLPNGFVTLVVAESGQGKSMLVLDIVGRFISGEPFPESETRPETTGSILWIDTEHAQAMNLDRVERFGLDRSRFLLPLADPFDTVNLENPDHRQKVTEAALRPEVAVIVIDSLSGSHRTKENGTEMVEILSFLSGLAQSCNKPIILIHHFNKINTEGKLPTLTNVRGSSSIPQMCRVVWAVDAPVPDDPSLKRLSVIKDNLDKPPEPLGFIIDEDRITYTDAPESPRKPKGRVEQVKEWLGDRVRETPVASTVIEKEAEEHGFSLITVKRAKRELGIQSIKRGGIWFYALPGQEDQEEEPENDDPLDLLDPHASRSTGGGEEA